MSLGTLTLIQCPSNLVNDQSPSKRQKNTVALAKYRWNKGNTDLVQFNDMDTTYKSVSTSKKSKNKWNGNKTLFMTLYLFKFTW